MMDEDLRSCDMFNLLVKIEGNIDRVTSAWSSMEQRNINVTHPHSPHTLSHAPLSNVTYYTTWKQIVVNLIYKHHTFKTHHIINTVFKVP